VKTKNVLNEFMPLLLVWSGPGGRMGGPLQNAAAWWVGVSNFLRRHDPDQVRGVCSQPDFTGTPTETLAR
jgi:hypothetical protein